MTGKVVFLDPLSPERTAAIAALLPPAFTLAVATGRDAAAQLAAIADARYAISGDVPITEEMLRGAPHLKAIHKWGVGVDNFALPTARALGITVMRTTGSNALPVAESALALMLALGRNVVRGHEALRAGRWIKGELAASSATLSGRTVGLVGLGAIGRHVARLLRGFECRILYAMPRRLDAADERELGVEHASLEALLAASDVVSLHCPLTPTTRALIDATKLALMKPDAVLVNVARGGIVVEADLVEALRGGVIRAAAIDVFEVEPTPPGNPLLGLPNAIVTPHCASLAAGNFAKTVARMFDNLLRIERGKPLPPLDLVT